MKTTSIAIAIFLAMSVAALVLWSDVRASEMAEENKAQVLQLMRDLNDGKDVECEPMMRLLLGIGREDEFDPKKIAHLLGIEDAQAYDCDGLVRTLLGLEEGEEIDNQQLVKLLLGIRDDSEITDEQIQKLLDGSYSKSKEPV
jgi:hypothetical protein